MKRREIDRDTLRAMVAKTARMVAEAETDVRTKSGLSLVGARLQLWGARRLHSKYSETIAAEDAEDAAAARQAGHEGPWVG